MPTYDASDRQCFRYCRACHRCEDKGRHPWCWSCTGRIDKLRQYDAYDTDDFCQCSQGVLRWRTKQGRLVIARYPSNPYKGSVQGSHRGQDERDWDQFMAESREKLNDPTWDPIQFSDGTSTWDWSRTLEGGA